VYTSKTYFKDIIFQQIILVSIGREIKFFSYKLNIIPSEAIISVAKSVPERLTQSTDCYLSQICHV
jgi:hypothetical protein